MSYLPDALRLASGCTVQAAAIWHRHSSDNRPYGHGHLRPLTLAIHRLLKEGTHMNVWFITKDLLLNDHAAVKPGEPGGRPADQRRDAPGRPESQSRSMRAGSMHRPVVALIALAAAGALAAGCGGNGPSYGGSGGGPYGSGGSPTGTAPSGVATVAATSTKLGQILVDGNGRTLYLFQKDQPRPVGLRWRLRLRLAARPEQRHPQGGEPRPGLAAGHDQAQRRHYPGHL